MGCVRLKAESLKFLPRYIDESMLFARFLTLSNQMFEVKMSKQLFQALVALPLCFIFTSCSMFAPSTQQVTVTASERDAQIFINGNLMGTGVASSSVRRNQDVSIMAKKDGYYPATRTIEPTLSTAGVLDIIGGCIWLIPFFGLLASGSHKLDTNNITILMSPTK